MLLPPEPATITTSFSWLHVLPDPAMETLPATMNAIRSLEGMLDGVAYPHVAPEAGVDARICPLAVSPVVSPAVSAMNVATPE